MLVYVVVLMQSMDSLDLINQLPAVMADSTLDADWTATGAERHTTAQPVHALTQPGSSQHSDAVRGCGMGGDTDRGFVSALSYHAAGQQGSSTGLDKLGPGYLSNQDVQLQLLPEQVRPEVCGLQDGMCWTSSCSLAGALQPQSQSDGAAAAPFSGSSSLLQSAATGSGSGRCTLDAVAGLGGAPASSRFAVNQAVGASMCGSGHRASGGLEGVSSWQGVGSPAVPAPDQHNSSKSQGMLRGQCNAGLSVPAGIVQQQRVQPPQDMYAHMCQPQDMAVVTQRGVPSNEQVLALLAAPLPGDFALGSCARQQYTEVMLYTEKGPHVVDPSALAQQLQQWGSQSALASTAGPHSCSSTHGQALRGDVEKYLLLLMGSLRRTVDLGRLVIVLRVGGDGDSSAASRGEVGLIIAASASNKAAAEGAVMRLLDSMDGVMQALAH